MTKYETIEAQGEAMRMLCEFDIARALDSLRVDDPLDGIVFAPGSENISMNVSIVGKSMVVDGDVYSNSPLAVRGTVNGNIKTTSDIGINGLVNGDIIGENVDFKAAAVKGNTKATREVNISNHSVIIGDINADKMTIDGKVKGNITATNSLFFKANSLMVGTIAAGGINMEDGSRVDASITLTNKTIQRIDDSEFDLEV